ncbi:MAG: acyltransferase [Microthrixaceae bacterium]
MNAPGERPTQARGGVGGAADGFAGGIAGGGSGVQADLSPAARVMSGSSPVRFPALDGCRALAAIGVVITHLGLISGFISRHESVGRFMARMDVGVSVFFVLSGFLLYRPIVAARFAGKEPRDVGSYARRRLLRIFPAYWVALIVVAFVLKAPGFFEPHSIVAHFFLLHVYDSTQLVGGPIQQSWSLATELAFYAFVPVWAWFMSRKARTIEAQLKLEVVSLVGLLVASTLANAVLVAIGVSGSTFAMLGTWLPFRVGDFVPGMLLAVLSAWVSHRQIRLPEWLVGLPVTLGCWAGAVVAFWVVSTRLNLPMFPTFTPKQAFAVRIIYVVVAALVVLPAVVGRQSGRVVQALFANRLAIWVGLVSYGIYIWHEAWLDIYLRWFDEQVLAASIVGMGLFAVAMTMICAAASWYLIERPVMEWGLKRR